MSAEVGKVRRVLQDERLQHRADGPRQHGTIPAPHRHQRCVPHRLKRPHWPLSLGPILPSAAASSQRPLPGERGWCLPFPKLMCLCTWCVVLFPSMVIVDGARFLRACQVGMRWRGTCWRTLGTSGNTSDGDPPSRRLFDDRPVGGYRRLCGRLLGRNQLLGGAQE